VSVSQDGSQLTLQYEPAQLPGPTVPA